MLTSVRTKGTRLFRPKRFNSPLYAVYALVELGEHEFILFRGKAIQRLRDGFRGEVDRGKWSRVYRSPLKAMRQAVVW
jgi:hypothetical protein